MQQNPAAFMVFFTCIAPLALIMFGVWIGRGRPLPGGRRFVLTIRDGRGESFHDDD